MAARTATTGWPVEEELAYDGAQMVASWDGSGLATWAATWGAGVDNLVSVKPSPDSPEVLAVKDGRGSVVGYYQGEAATPGYLATADYTPEGRATFHNWSGSTTCTETGTNQCGRLGGLPFGFHSAYKSPAHGLLYFRNRWYSVESGQWLTQDPLGEVDSVNLYTFNRNDGVNFIDPFGLSGEGAAAGQEGVLGAPEKAPNLDECVEVGANCPSYGPDGKQKGSSEVSSEDVKPRAPDLTAAQQATSDRRDPAKRGSRGGSDAPSAPSPSSPASRPPGTAPAALAARGVLDLLLAQVARVHPITNVSDTPKSSRSRNPFRKRVLNFDKASQHFNGWGRERLKKLNESEGPPVIIVFDQPPKVNGEKPGWGLTCRTQCGFKKSDPARIFVDEARIKSEGPARATVSEVAAHEIGHFESGEDGDDGSPRPDEGESYLESIQMRDQEGVPTTLEWLQAHPQASDAARKNWLLNQRVKNIGRSP